MDSAQLTLPPLFDRTLALYPGREVVSVTDGAVVRTTYAELAARADRLCWTLHALGVGRGGRVATLAWNDQRHLELYVAVPAFGAVLHTVNVRLGTDQIVDIVGHAGDQVLFVDPDQVEALRHALGDLPALRHVVVLADHLPAEAPGHWLAYEDLLASAPSGPPPRPDDLREGEPAATSYSSATTGRPKGVVYSHRALHLHTLALCLADTWAISEADTILPVVPMYHVNAWGLPFAALATGARLVLPGRRPSAATIAALLRDEAVTFTAAVPTVWMDVIDELCRDGTGPTSPGPASPGPASPGLPALRMMVSGGAPLPSRLLDQADDLGLPMVHSYGMTEASPLVLVGRPKSHLRAERGIERRLRQGLPVPGVTMSVRDEDGDEVPWDGQAVGELWLRGPWVAEGYQDDPDRSAAAFVDGWYRSGDVVSVDAEGYVKVADRTADLIKSGGEWISSVDLENGLMAHPGVRAAAVIGVDHPRWQERPLAVVALADGASTTGDELREHLAETFPRWWLPDEIVLVDEVPVTTVGKFDKRSLRHRFAQHWQKTGAGTE